jgi:hypothetical protein
VHAKAPGFREPVQQEVLLEEDERGSVWFKSVNGSCIGPLVKVERIESVSGTDIGSELDHFRQSPQPPVDFTLVRADKYLCLMLQIQLHQQAAKYAGLYPPRFAAAGYHEVLDATQ